MLSKVAHVLPRGILHDELPKTRALKRRAQLGLADPVLGRDEAVVRLREELALVLLGLDVRHEEGAAGLEEEREGAGDVVDGREVVVGRAALS